MNKIQHPEKYTWLKHWAGKWSILTCTYIGYQYTKTLEETLGSSLDVSIFIFRKGLSVCSLEQDDYHKFGEQLAIKVMNDHKVALDWCKDMKKETDDILSLINKYNKSKITVDDYNSFLEMFFGYESSHRAIKVSVNFLPEKDLQELLPKLTEARLYAEPVYAETEKFMRKFSKQLSKQVGIAAELILCMTKDEFPEFLKTGKAPSIKILQDRFDSSAVLFTKGGNCRIVTGKEVGNIETDLNSSLLNKKIINGTTAYPGFVRGTARVILDTQKKNKFNKGDILVTEMTRPEYLSLVEKSAAFITDAGGMLCHAAITARELQKPCIVGLEVATKVLQNGDMVEVDADHGIIRIIK